VRLDTYGFTDEEMSGAIDRLLGQHELTGRLDTIAKRLQAKPGNVRAADLIAQVADRAEPLRS
jgi:hypothetical protein